MCWLGQGNRPRRSSTPRLAVTALIAAGLLPWAPGAGAEAYPDAPTSTSPRSAPMTPPRHRLHLRWRHHQHHHPRPERRRRHGHRRLLRRRRQSGHHRRRQDRTTTRRGTTRTTARTTATATTTPRPRPPKRRHLRRRRRWRGDRRRERQLRWQCRHGHRRWRHLGRRLRRLRHALGGVYIDGGTVTNETIITVSADGGTAIADASGGDDNIASNGGSAGNGGSITSSAGNGGISNASADGGAISIGDINCGGNAGNAISVGDTFAAPVFRFAASRHQARAGYPSDHGSRQAASAGVSARKGRNRDQTAGHRRRLRPASQPARQPPWPW